MLFICLSADALSCFHGHRYRHSGEDPGRAEAGPRNLGEVRRVLGDGLRGRETGQIRQRLLDAPLTAETARADEETR